MVRRSAGERERGREGKREGGTPPKDPKVAQDRHKVAQDGTRVAPTWPTIAQDAPQRTVYASTYIQNLWRMCIAFKHDDRQTHDLTYSLTVGPLVRWSAGGVESVA